jgi:protease-4
MDPKDLEIKKLKKEISISSIKQYAFILLFIAEIVFLAALFIDFFQIKNPFSSDISKEKIALLHIDKPITTRYISHLIKSVEEMKKEKKYKALLVDVSSPGGSPTASQEFAEYLKELNQTMPVTMYVNDMAASGAYYIASAIKPIHANKNAIVGSIGVIMPHYNLSELADKIGVKEDTITAGKFKQPLSLFKEMTEENKKYIENVMLKPTYKNFIDDVAQNRGIARQKIEKFAEGKVYIASMPEIQGVLVDKITNLYKLKNELKSKYHNAEFETIGEKTTPRNFLHVMVKEVLSLLLQNQTSLR